MKDNPNRQFSFEEATIYSNQKKLWQIFSRSKVLLSGCVALFISVIEIPFGIFVHSIADFISNVWEKSFAYVVTVLTVLFAVPMVVSLILTVFSFFELSKIRKSAF